MNVKTYKNVLEAHTAFVLDRYNFMANIQAAIYKEENETSKALFSILKEGNFVELIAGLMEDPDAHNREQALYTLANLLALEKQESLVARTKKTLLERICSLSHNLYDPLTPLIQKTTAYVYHNLGLVFANRGWKDLDKDEDGRVTDFCNRVMDIYNGLYGAAPLMTEIANKQARKDLFNAVEYVSRVRSRSARIERILADMLGASVMEMRALLEILMARLSEDGTQVPVDLQDELLDRFLLILTTDAYGAKSHMLALFGLSNFVVEPGVANKAALYDELLEAVLECAFLRTGLQRTNAIWTLANMVSKVTDEEAQEALSRNCAVRTALVDAVSDIDVLSDRKAAVAAEEALAILDKWVEKYTEEDETEELEPEYPNVVEETAHVTKEEAEAFDAAILQQEGRPIILSHPPVERPVERVPTALDLMLEGRTSPSAVVRGLVNQVRAAGFGNWVAVPDNTVLMIEDITTLQMMGYVIQRGYIGVNPLLMNSI